MKYFILFVIVFITLVFLTWLTTARAAGPAKTDDITGYAEFTLLEPVPAVEGLIGPVLDNSSTSEHALYDYGWTDSLTVGYFTASTEINIIEEDSKVIALAVYFEDLVLEFDDLEQVALFVAELRIMFLDKYSEDLVAVDLFDFGDSDNYSTWYTGALVLIDEDGDMLAYSWNGYSLCILYTTVPFQAVMQEFETNNLEETKDKI